MNNHKRLALHLCAVLAFATLFGTSAFAENRHEHGTRDRGDRGQTNTQRYDRGRSANQNFDRGARHDDGGGRAGRSYQRSDERSFDRGTQRYDRGQSDNRSFDRNYKRGQSDNRSFDRNNRGQSDHRSFDRNFDRGRSGSSFRERSFDSRGHAGSYDRGRQPYSASGRVSRYERWGSGYRVWLGGIAYPFFIPEARFRLFPRFHVGLSIRLGGYYNPLGYYDYYDGSYGGSYGGQVYTSGVLRGVIESVDYRRGTFVVHDDVSGAFVTVVMRGSDRRLNDLRIGDSIDVSGDWARNGVFEAYRVDSIDSDGYRDGYRR